MRSRFVTRQRPRDARAGGRLETGGRLRAAAPRVSRTRLQLAQGDAAARRGGFHVVAPDQRGYGRTTGWDADYDGDLGSFRLLNLVRDTLGLVVALGYRKVAAVVGHDFGAAGGGVVRARAARRVPLGGADERAVRRPRRRSDIGAALAALPRPRKHYQWYYSTREANADMRHCPQGVHAFLRAYFHSKSADWKENRPFRLAAWSATSWRRCRPTTSWTWTRTWLRRWRRRCRPGR